MTYLGENIKKLGFGLMRLPKNGSEIDIEETKKMVDTFLDAGFTYFDTARVYGGSEDAVRKALVERHPRKSYQLATKNAAWMQCKTAEDAMAQLETSLEKTGAGYFDYYLLHNLGDGRTKLFDDFKLWDFAQKKKEEGIIKHLGFSFHSTPEQLEQILKAHPEAEFVQLQINYADWNYPSIKSRECYEVARKYNKPVIIMEPVKGGMLAEPPQSVSRILKAAEPQSSCASWAIRFAANLDGVITVLSGMSDMEQLTDNISYMKDFDRLSDKELHTIEAAMGEIAKVPIIPCTNCNYCAKVCPNNVGISALFTAMNQYKLYGDRDAAAKRAEELAGDRKKAADCIKCGKCETVCPQHIAIREELEKVADAIE